MQALEDHDVISKHKQDDNSLQSLESAFKPDARLPQEVDEPPPPKDLFELLHELKDDSKLREVTRYLNLRLKTFTWRLLPLSVCLSSVVIMYFVS